MNFMCVFDAMKLSSLNRKMQGDSSEKILETVILS